jgi:hypothetical protein
MGSSIHIQKSVSGSVGHNSREHFTYSVVFTDEPNECTTSQAEAYKTYRAELAERSQKYTERTGQKLQKSAVTQLSAVVNLEQHHTLKDLEPIKAELERTFGTKVYQMAIHRDEGKLVSKKDGTELYSGKDFFLNQNDNALYFDKKFTKPVPMQDYEIKKNYHAHIEMMGLDSEGKAIRQKMNKVALQKLQTFTANTLQMERGQQTKSYTKEQMSEILAKVGNKSDYESTTLYAKRFNEVAKELGYYHEKRKRKDTHEFKDQGVERESAKRSVLAKEADLKAEIAKLRATLKEQGGKREDYAKLEQANRELKEQLKDKSLTIEDLAKKISGLQSTVNGLESKNKHLEEELHQKQLESDSRPNMSDLEQEAEEYLHKELGIRHKGGKFTLVGAFKYLVGKVKELMTENKQLKQENEVLARANQEHVDNTNLDDLLEELQERTRKFEEGVRVNEIPKFTEEDWRDQLNEVPELPKSRRYK